MAAYPKPRNAAQAERLYRHVEETEGRAAADALDRAWLDDEERAADAAYQRRQAITVGAVDADPGRGACRHCAELIGNYHALNCARLTGDSATAAPNEYRPANGRPYDATRDPLRGGRL